MRFVRSSFLLALVIALGAHAALAQTSPSYHLTEHVLNAGGDPRVATLASASYHVKLDAIGDGVLATSLASASYHGDGGFVVVYRPPGEIAGLRFTSRTALSWSPERTVGHYELYRDLLTALAGGSTGTCLESALTNESATDSAVPPKKNGYFYLVTVRNRLDEEGTKGSRTNGAERPNPAPCP